MMDLPAMDPCPFHERGRHNLLPILPELAEELTFFCRACGALRRAPLTGSLEHGSLDMLTADEIERRIYGRPA